MELRQSRVLGLTLVAFAFRSAPAWSQTTRLAVTEASTTPTWFTFLIIFLVLVGALVSLLLIRKAVTKSGRRLSDALSEEVTITAMTSDGAGGQKPLLTASGSTQTVTVLCASSSRLIALMGLMVILLLFLGFGSLALYQFAGTGQMPPDINDVVKFLVAGLTLFAPYLVNKFASVFESISN